MSSHEIEVSEEFDGDRLDAFLAEHVGSRSNAAKLIAAGNVIAVLQAKARTVLSETPAA